MGRGSVLTHKIKPWRDHLLIASLATTLTLALTHPWTHTQAAPNGNRCRIEDPGKVIQKSKDNLWQQLKEVNEQGKTFREKIALLAERRKRMLASERAAQRSRVADHRIRQMKHFKNDTQAWGRSLQKRWSDGEKSDDLLEETLAYMTEIDTSFAQNADRYWEDFGLFRTNRRPRLFSGSPFASVGTYEKYTSLNPLRVLVDKGRDYLVVPARKTKDLEGFANYLGELSDETFKVIHPEWDNLRGPVRHAWKAATEDKSVIAVLKDANERFVDEVSELKRLYVKNRKEFERRIKSDLDPDLLRKIDQKGAWQVMKEESRKIADSFRGKPKGNEYYEKLDRLVKQVAYYLGPLIAGSWRASVVGGVAYGYAVFWDTPKDAIDTYEQLTHTDEKSLALKEQAERDSKRYKESPESENAAIWNPDMGNELAHLQIAVAHQLPQLIEKIEAEISRSEDFIQKVESRLDNGKTTLKLRNSDGSIAELDRDGMKRRIADEKLDNIERNRFLKEAKTKLSESKQTLKTEERYHQNWRKKVSTRTWREPVRITCTAYRLKAWKEDAEVYEESLQALENQGVSVPETAQIGSWAPDTQMSFDDLAPDAQKIIKKGRIYDFDNMHNEYMVRREALKDIRLVLPYCEFYGYR